jgi:hypothetical protein
MKSLLLKIVLLTSLLVPMLGFAGSASAAYSVVPGCANGGSLANVPNPNGGKGADVCTDVNSVNSGTQDPIYKIIKTAIEVISFVTGVAASILIIISGLRFITSGGDPAKVGQAKSSLLYAIIGIFIVMISQGIIVFILNKVS